jgi:transcriptional regulator with GAF, ATPase, and Fis domain
MKLTVVEEGTRSEIELTRSVISIGRAVDNDIRLTSALVSRHHCRIETGAEGSWVVDLGSANGTSVNGSKVTRRLLEAGDRVQVGAARILLDAGEDGEPPSPLDTQSVSLEPDLSPVGLRTMTGDGKEGRDDLVVFARISRELSRETEIDKLLRLIVDAAVGLVGGERGFLLLSAGARADGVRSDGASGARRDPATAAAEAGVSGMTIRLARSFDRADIPLPSSRVSLGIAGQVLRSGRPLLSIDAGNDERFSDMQSVEDLKLRSVMCLPIRIEDRVDGVLYVDNRLQRGAFSQENLDFVELLANQAAIAIRNTRLLAELRDQNGRLVESRKQIERLNGELGRRVRDQDSELAVVRAELGRERGRYDYSSIVGASDAMRNVFRQLDRIIDSDLPVLIQGSSGTGKELIARAIHFNGARSGKSFVTENCAALPDTLLESELFGHMRGAFTGAHRRKTGLLEQADGGTLFLDEIGDMSAEMQKKLLRVLQEGEFRPVGSDHRIQVNVRLLAASNRDLADLVREGKFREDLFYRVHVLTVSLPQLRERRDDVPLLAEHLLARAAREAGKPAPELTPDVLAALLAYDWPGNVRELENEMRRLVVLAGSEARPEHLSSAVIERRSLFAPSTTTAASPDEIRIESAGGAADIRAAVADLERRSIETALARARGNKSKAAADLGISRFALQRKLDKYGIGRARADAGESGGEAATDEGTTVDAGATADESTEGPVPPPPDGA